MSKNQLALFAAGFVLALSFTFSCSSGDDPDPSSSSWGVVHGTPVAYEGETYPTVVIGTQTWFAKNLNYAVEGSKCYDNDPARCNEYGRLYDWSTAMALPSSCNWNSCSSQIQSKHEGICPSGWHIPSNADWDKLYRYVDGTSGTEGPYNSPTAGRDLKTAPGWHNNGNSSTDKHGFSALPGGHGTSDGSFVFGSLFGNWWSASEGEYGSYASYRHMYYNYDGAGWDNDRKSRLFSVRCLQD